MIHCKQPTKLLSFQQSQDSMLASWSLSKISHFCSYTQLLNTVILFFSCVNIHCSKTSYLQCKKKSQHLGALLLLGLLCPSILSLILLELVAFLGGRKERGSMYCRRVTNYSFGEILGEKQTFKQVSRVREYRSEKLLRPFWLLSY